MKIVATTSLVGELVQQVGGEHVRVQTLMGAGVDPHIYKATALDILKLQSADAVFYNGLHLEGRMTDLFERLRKHGKYAYGIANVICSDQLLGIEGSQNVADSHIWFDPLLWGMCALYTAEALSEMDPNHADYYEARAKEASNTLAELHEWGLRRVQELEPQRRILVTSHDAYNYFGKAFGFNVVGVQGISTVSEAGLADIVGMVDFIKQHQVKAIFVETSVSPAAIARISEDSGAKIGGKLFSDSLGAQGEMLETNKGNCYDVGTYVGMLKYNMDTIIGALK